MPDRLTVLDGGLSTALEQAGADVSGELWTARLLLDDPEAIVAAHVAYFEAGADVATTASYQASLGSMSPETIASSVTLARRASEQTSRSGLLVAASVGPYGAVLADGSEYRGDYGLSAAQLREFHLPRLEVLASADPDVFAVETIPDVREAEVLVALLDQVGVPAWFSYSVADGCTRAGQPLRDAFATVAASSTVVAAGVNCCAPEDVLYAVETAGALTGRPVVVYPNRGGGWDATTNTWTDSPSYPLELVPSWVAAGARLIGGCCQVDAGDIARLAAALRTEA